MPKTIDPLVLNGARSLRSADLVAFGAFVTVSPTGISTGTTYWNNGADYGPDTPSTKTSGIYEAIATGNPTRLLPGTFSVSPTAGFTSTVAHLLLEGAGEGKTVVQISSSLSGASFVGPFFQPTLDTLSTASASLIVRGITFDFNNVAASTGNQSAWFDGITWNGGSPIARIEFDGCSFINQVYDSGGTVGGRCIGSVVGAHKTFVYVHGCHFNSLIGDVIGIDGADLVLADGNEVGSIKVNPFVVMEGPGHLIVSNNGYVEGNTGSGFSAGGSFARIFFTGNGNAVVADVFGNDVSGHPSAAISIGDLAGGLTGNTVTLRGSGNAWSSSQGGAAFYSATTTATVTVNLSDNPGYNPQGFGTITPAFPDSTVDVTNTNPYRVLIYITVAGSSSAMVLTDTHGNVQSLAFGIFAGYNFPLDPGEKVHFNWLTNRPDWVWYGC